MGYAVKLQSRDRINSIFTGIYHPYNESRIRAVIGTNFKSLIDNINHNILTCIDDLVTYSDYTTGDYGAPFNVTLPITDTMSVQYLSTTSYYAYYFYVNVLKNGAVVTSYKATTVKTLDFDYKFTFVINLDLA